MTTRGRAFAIIALVAATLVPMAIDAGRSDGTDAVEDAAGPQAYYVMICRDARGSRDRRACRRPGKATPRVAVCLK